MACSAIVPIAALAVAASAPILTSCEKEKPNPQPTPTNPKTTTVVFRPGECTIDLSANTLDSLCAIYDIVYAQPATGWGYYNTQMINGLTNALQVRHNYYDKLKADEKNNSFDFTAGVADPADSIALVNMGYKIIPQAQR